MATLDFGLVLGVTARGGTLADMAAINDRILAAYTVHDLRGAPCAALVHGLLERGRTDLFLSEVLPRFTRATQRG